MIQVPITAPRTYEDPSIVDPEERERVFGQWDHVRRYGPDFRDRLCAAGFEVNVYTATDLVGEDELERLGLREGQEVFHCTPSPES